MISINATLFLQILHFLILIFILNRLMFRPTLKVINERAQFIEKTKEEIENIEVKTTELAEKCISMEKDARRNAGDERSKMNAEAKDVAEKLFQETKEEIAVIREKVDNDIKAQLGDAKTFLQREAEILADEITEKVIGRRIDL